MATRTALTLAELVMVLFIMAAIGGVLIPLCSDQVNDARFTTTRGSLVHTATAINQYWSDTKFIDLDGVNTVSSEANRFSIDWLFRSPVTGTSVSGYDKNSKIGWNGPYVTNSTGEITVWGGPVLLDAWQHRLVTQLVNPNASPKDVRIVSAGPNGVVDIPAGTATSALTTQSIGDDIYVSLMLR